MDDIHHLLHTVNDLVVSAVLVHRGMCLLLLLFLQFDTVSDELFIQLLEGRHGLQESTVGSVPESG